MLLQYSHLYGPCSKNFQQAQKLWMKVNIFNIGTISEQSKLCTNSKNVYQIVEALQYFLKNNVNVNKLLERWSFIFLVKQRFTYRVSLFCVDLKNTLFNAVSFNEKKSILWKICLWKHLNNYVLFLQERENNWIKKFKLPIQKKRSTQRKEN